MLNALKQKGYIKMIFITKGIKLEESVKQIKGYIKMIFITKGIKLEENVKQIKQSER